jgi:hypothetical protein
VNHRGRTPATPSITLSRERKLWGPRKEKPGGGNAGSDFVVIGVYGFKYAAWLSFMPLESGESVLFLLYSQCFFLLLLFSCSSITF